MDICPSGITQVTPCDGTANSEKWCCGGSNGCCTTNKGVVTLKQVFVGLTSSVVSSTTVASPTSSKASKPATSTGVGPSAKPSAHGLPGSVIAGIVIGVIVILAVVLAGFLLSRQRSLGRYLTRTDGSLIAEVSGLPPRHELSPSTKGSDMHELPGPPPEELQGDPARGSMINVHS